METPDAIAIKSCHPQPSDAVSASDGRNRHAALLRAGAAGDDAALMELCRLVTTVLEGAGAYGLTRTWSQFTEEIVRLLLGSFAPDSAQIPDLEQVVKNQLWGRILDRMHDNDSKAYEFFVASAMRLLAKLDRGGRHEDSWEDIIQVTAIQILNSWERGTAESPWPLFCTILKRRYYDWVRASRPDETLTTEVEAELAGGPEPLGEILPTKARELLSASEWDIISRMDIEGQTRREIAAALRMTEGQVLSTRRAGLRKLYRLIGSNLSAELQCLWNAMFKGAVRVRPEDVARKLGLSVEEVMNRLTRAREELSLA